MEDFENSESKEKIEVRQNRSLRFWNLTSVQWNLVTLGLTFLILLSCAAVTYYIDPAMHYHAPVEGISYQLMDERYQNDGLVKHLDYDGIIVGSSMCQNFRPSEMNDCLGTTNSIKACLQGASYHQIDEVLRTAFDSHNSIGMVIRNIDYSSMENDHDNILILGGEDPTYLYDKNPWNDVHYLLNRQMLLGSVYRNIQATHLGIASTSRNDYGFWSDDYTYGYETIMDGKDVEYLTPVQVSASEELLTAVRDNVSENIVKTVEEHPETEFYLFFPPYSIGYWQMMYARGDAKKLLDMEAAIVDLLVSYENVKLFSFNDAFEFEMIQDFSNYKDMTHYGAWVNSWMMIWMREGIGQITVENAGEYKERMADFFLNYDYDHTYDEWR